MEYRKIIVRLLTGIVTAVWIYGIPVPCFAANEAVKHPKILFISSYNYDWDSIPKQLEGFRHVINGYANVNYVFMDTKKKTYDEVKESVFIEIQREMELEGGMDLVVAGDDAALDFVLEYQQELFDEIPIVFQGINTEEKAHFAAEDPLITGIVESFPIEETVALARDLYPQATRIVGISDESESGLGSLKQFYDCEAVFPDLQFEDMNCSVLTETAIREQISSYREDTILLFLMLTKDGEGYSYSQLAAAEMVTSAARIPVFKADELGIGNGMLGGVVVLYGEMAGMAAQTALDILNGMPASEIPVRTATSYALFDEKIMKQFGISQTDLPRKAEIINHDPDFWERYQDVLRPAISIIAILVLILVLYVSWSRSRKKYYEELKERDLMLDNLVKNIPGGIAIFRAEGRIKLLYFSDGLSSLMGRTREEYEEWIRGDLFRYSIYEEDAEKVETTVFNAISHGAPICVTCRMKHKEGEPVWVQMSAVQIRTENACPIYYAVFTTLPQEAILYRGIATDCPNGILVCDAENYNILYLNKSICSLHKASGSYAGKKCYEYLVHRDNPCTECHKGHQSVEGYYTREVEVPGSAMHLMMRGKMIDWNGRKAYIEYVTDETDRYKKQRERLEIALEEAKAANIAKSDFLSRMSHDMRTPLNAVLSLTSKELLEDADEEMKDGYLEQIHTSGSYLLGIISDILDMAKIEGKKLVLNPERYSVQEFGKMIATVIGEPCRKKNIAFQFDVDRIPFQWIKVDKIHFNQIFVNLLSNAVKFTNQNGKIEFTIENIRQQGSKIRKRFTVRDNGIGMSKEFIPYAFESFSQEGNMQYAAHNTGTGLGLAIVKNLVELMGGTIQLESELGKGTVFTVELEVEVLEQPEDTIEKKELEIILDGVHVLLCEDNLINARIAKKLLERKGCLVDHEENGQLGVERFEQSSQGYYDAILMDIKMPVMNGLEAARRIRHLSRRDAESVPIIAMTANAYAEDARASIEAGMNVHLGKPVESQVLYVTLMEQVERKRGLEQERENW